MGKGSFPAGEIESKLYWSDGPFLKFNIKKRQTKTTVGQKEEIRAFPVVPDGSKAVSRPCLHKYETTVLFGPRDRSAKAPREKFFNCFSFVCALRRIA